MSHEDYWGVEHLSYREQLSELELCSLEKA